MSAAETKAFMAGAEEPLDAARDGRVAGALATPIDERSSNYNPEKTVRACAQTQALAQGLGGS